VPGCPLRPASCIAPVRLYDNDRTYGRVLPSATLAPHQRACMITTEHTEEFLRPNMPMEPTIDFGYEAPRLCVFSLVVRRVLNFSCVFTQS
jgi:hypothetical protein